MRTAKAHNLNRERRRRGVVLAVAMLLAAPALVSSQTRNHSFELDGANATVCADGAVFDGQAIAGSALHIPLTSEVYDAAGTTLLFTGDTHTFSAVNEPHTFTVLTTPGALTVGSTVTLSVTDVPGTAFGNEGDGDTVTVADCSLDICGDGNVDPGETCDPADPVAPAGCRPAGDPAQCTFCGDGNQDPSEGCDDGNTTDGDGCTSMCTAETFCGDGHVDPGEGCDDGNTTDGDGCSAMCMVETPTLGQWGGIALGLALLVAAMLAGRGALARGARGGARGSVLALLLFCAAALPATAEVVGPTFSKEFSPATIGPGSTSMLTFTIDNTNGSGPAGELAFTDILPTMPGAVTLAAPGFVSNTCGGTVSAPDGGGTISLTDGMVGVGATCTIVVNVTAGTAGEHTNTSGSLTWKIGAENGSSAAATDDLTVDVDLPGFSKSFSPGTVALGGRSTLTFTIDNVLNPGNVNELDFTDVLPPGMVIASPSMKSTTCGTATIPPTLTAVSGTTTITLDANGVGAFPALEDGDTCTVAVDVIGGAAGSLGNVSENLQASFVDAGKAAAVLTVTGFEDPLTIEKEFLDDPVAPGGKVTLRFKITNRSRDDAATGITFTDTIDPLGALTGIVATLPPTPNPPCGVGSSLAFGSGALTLTGGTLGPEGACTFDVKLTLPAGATPGAYTNTTGAVSGDVGGEPETGNMASDLLFVEAFPVLTKEFTDDPVGAGGTVTLEFTITNPGTSAMTDIEFLDELTNNGGAAGALGNGFLPFPVSVTLPPVPDPPCGGGSSLAVVPAGTNRQALQLTGGSLAAAGMAGNSCTFEVTLDIPAGLAPGTYTNTTEEITATAAMATVTGPPATDDIVVVAAPQIAKEFTDDPVVPGGTVTLEFTLENLDPDNAASAIAFSDNLEATLDGLTLTSVLLNDCGGTVSGVGTEIFSYSGGSLAADDGVPDSGPDQCTIRVSLTLPGAPPGPPGGTFPNTTSEPTAVVLGVSAASAAAEDDLVVAGLQFTKEFVGDPVIAGGMVTLRFNFQNLGTIMADDASAIFFTDDLTQILSGPPDVTSTGPGPSLDTCGGTDFSSATFLFYVGGSVGFGSTCTIEYDLLVPAGVADDEYSNVTSSLSATINGSSVILPPARDDLAIQSDLLALTKEFTDDPVNPGDSVTLEFTLENLDPLNAASGIAFSDNLGDAGGALAGLEAQSPALLNDCGGMATLPATTFSYSGGSLPPGGTCTIRLSLNVPAGPLPGNLFPNVTSGVTGTILGLPVTGDPASDDLEVDTITFTKSFDGPTVAGGTAVLTFEITNLDSANAVAGLAFSDNLTAVVSGLTATLPPVPNPPCGAGSAVSGTSFLALTGASLPAGGGCSFAVTVNVPGTATPGSFPNTTSRLFDSGIPVAPPATAFLEIEPPPTFVKAFAPDTILPGAVSTITFTIGNSASVLAATALDFTDNLPPNLVVAMPPNASTTCTGGTLTAVAGSGVVSYSGGSVAAGGSCTVKVDVTSAVPATYVNLTGELTSSSGNSGTATDTLTVQPPPPVFSKLFVPNPAGESFDTKLTFTIDNSGSPVAADSLAFFDMLPFDLVVAAVPAVTNTCGGSVVATPGSTTISLTGGSVAAGATCTTSVQVNAPSPGGPFVNLSGDLTSTSGNSGPATDTLFVNACMAADGLNQTVTGLVLGTLAVEVCRTIKLGPHLKVDGPAGVLALKAGVSVIFLDGVEFGKGSTVTISIDPSLIP